MLLIWFILVLLFFIIGGYLVGKLIAFFIPDSKEHTDKSDTFIFHNTVNETHNHLHVSKDDLKELIDK